MFLKGFLQAKEETLCLGTAGKTVLLSIISLNGEEGACAPAFSRQHFSAVLRSRGRMIHIYFGSKVNWSSSCHPSLPCTALFHPRAFTPATSQQLLHGDEMLGLIKQLRQVKNKPARKEGSPDCSPSPVQRAALEAAAVGGRDKGEGSKGTVSPRSHQ